MGAGVVPNYSDLPRGARVLAAPQSQQFSDLPEGAQVLPQDQTAHIGVNRGAPPAGSPGYQYSTGYQGPNDAPRDSGGFIDRMTTQAGRALQSPSNFLPSWKSLFPPLQAGEQALQEWQAYKNPAPREDPARTAGNMAPAALSALVTHAADAVPNLGAGSEMSYSGLAHPLEGAGRAIRSVPRPNLLQMVKDPLGSAMGAVRAAPEAIRAGLGEQIRIQPRPRPAPLWQQIQSEGMPVPSILNQSRPMPQVAAPVETPAPTRLVDAVRGEPTSNMPTAASRAASDAAFARNYPNEIWSSDMAPDAERAWQESAGFKVPEAAEDIGAKVRQQNPEPTRAEVALGRARKQAEALGQPRQRLIEQMGGKAPEAQWPPEEPAGPYRGPVKAQGGLAEQLNDKIVRERLIDQIRKSDQKWMAEERAERAARNSPAQRKGVMTGQVDEHGIPINRAQAEPATNLPEDLTDILRKSVEMAKKKRNPSGE